MYTIRITARAKNELKLIPKLPKQAIRTILNELKDNPYCGKPLTRELTGSYVYKIGVYRIIYKINKKDKIIFIITAGNRAYIYE